MNEYPALATELEQSLRNDRDGEYLRELQRSLRDFIAAVEQHTRSGLPMDQFALWRELQKAAETAIQVAEEVRELLHDPLRD